MQVSAILSYIDSGYMALPKFQRGYVWNRDQVRGLMDSLYHRHPVGSLLVWATPSADVSHRGAQELAPGVVRLLLDGQQRMTSLYGIIRGQPPTFFNDDRRAFTGLYFNLQDEEFRFYQPSRMQGDPFWINVSDLMQRGNDGVGEQVVRLGQVPAFAPHSGEFFGRLNRILGIRDIDLHVEEVTGTDKTIDVVVDIFNRVNSGGTKLSKGDLALAKICGTWPEGRERMQAILERWRDRGYDFTLDWLLRNVNAIVTGEARFVHLHDQPTAAIQDGLERAERCLDHALNLIDGRLGLDHDRVLFGRYALPVLARYIDRRGEPPGGWRRAGPPPLLVLPERHVGTVLRYHREHARPGPRGDRGTRRRHRADSSARSGSGAAAWRSSPSTSVAGAWGRGSTRCCMP